MAKCLVLGGDGFIGSHLVNELLAAGHKVRAFDRFDGGKARNLDKSKSNLEIIGGSFLEKSDLKQAVDGMDYVFHFISTTTPASSAQDPLLDIKTNVMMSVELLQLCAWAKVKRIIFPSSGGAIYGREQDEPFTEIDATEPVSPYAIAKLTVEGYLRFFKRAHELDYLVLRITNPYGERQNLVGNQGAIPIFLNHVAEDSPITIYGDGSMVRDYIYVGDVVQMIAAVFDKPSTFQIYNLGSGQYTTLLELLDTIHRVTGKAPKVKHEPQRVTDVHRVLVSTKRFEHDFGLKATTSLEDGLAKTWAYVREIKGLS